MSLKSTIVEYLKSRYPETIHKGTLGRLSVCEWGYENENMGRRCRELQNEGVIERIPNLKGEVQYRWIPEENRGIINTNETHPITPKEQITTTENDRRGGQGFTGLVSREVSRQEVRELRTEVRVDASLYREVAERTPSFQGNKPRIFMSQMPLFTPLLPRPKDNGAGDSG